MGGGEGGRMLLGEEAALVLVLVREYACRTLRLFPPHNPPDYAISLPLSRLTRTPT